MVKGNITVLIGTLDLGLTDLGPSPFPGERRRRICPGGHGLELTLADPALGHDLHLFEEQQVTELAAVPPRPPASPTRYASTPSERFPWATGAIRPSASRLCSRQSAHQARSSRSPEGGAAAADALQLLQAVAATGDVVEIKGRRRFSGNGLHFSSGCHRPPEPTPRPARTARANFWPSASSPSGGRPA